MTLSVLIPCVRSRLPKLKTLYDELEHQINGRPVEVLALLDNKRRSVGLKRDALVQAARGDYVAFVDDDDWISSHYIDALLMAADAWPDVIVFDTLSFINDAPPALGKHSLAHENEPYALPEFRRKPWQMHAWKRDLAQQFHFPDRNYGEDWAWVSQMIPHAKWELRASDVPLYHYRYSDVTTEASK